MPAPVAGGPGLGPRPAAIPRPGRRPARRSRRDGVVPARNPWIVSAPLSPATSTARTTPLGVCCETFTTDAGYSRLKPYRALRHPVSRITAGTVGGAPHGWPLAHVNTTTGATSTLVRIDSPIRTRNKNPKTWRTNLPGAPHRSEPSTLAQRRCSDGASGTGPGDEPPAPVAADSSSRPTWIVRARSEKSHEIEHQQPDEPAAGRQERLTYGGTRHEKSAQRQRHGRTTHHSKRLGVARRSPIAQPQRRADRRGRTHETIGMPRPSDSRRQTHGRTAPPGRRPAPIGGRCM